MNDTVTLQIEARESDDVGGIATISIFYAGEFQESINLGTASFDPKDMRFEKFCKKCKKSYLIPLGVIGSTYGAEWYVTVFQENEVNWSMAKLPVDGLHLVQKDGYFILETSDKTRYVLDGASLTPMK